MLGRLHGSFLIVKQGSLKIVGWVLLFEVFLLDIVELVLVELISQDLELVLIGF
jgi:hypothetical protein